MGGWMIWIDEERFQDTFDSYGERGPVVLEVSCGATVYSIGVWSNA